MREMLEIQQKSKKVCKSLIRGRIIVAKPTDPPTSTKE